MSVYFLRGQTHQGKAEERRQQRELGMKVGERFSCRTVSSGEVVEAPIHGVSKGRLDNVA